MSSHDFGGSLAVEGGATGEAFVENAAEGVEIGAGVEFELLELLGCHGVDGAEKGAG